MLQLAFITLISPVVIAFIVAITCIYVGIIIAEYALCVCTLPETRGDAKCGRKMQAEIYNNIQKCQAGKKYLNAAEMVKSGSLLQITLLEFCHWHLLLYKDREMNSKNMLLMFTLCEHCIWFKKLVCGRKYQLVDQ